MNHDGIGKNLQDGKCDGPQVNETIRGTAGNASCDAGSNGASATAPSSLRLSPVSAAAIFTKRNKLLRDVNDLDQQIDQIVNQLTELVTERSNLREALRHINEDVIRL